MKWFDIIKKPMSALVHRDLDPERNLLDLDTKRPIPQPPPQQYRRKIRRRKQAISALKPLNILAEDEECPPGELWCERHEECEPEKEWLTHNRHLTAEEIENQKLWQGSGKFGGNQFGGSGSTQGEKTQ